MAQTEKPAPTVEELEAQIAAIKASADVKLEAEDRARIQRIIEEAASMADTINRQRKREAEAKEVQRLKYLAGLQSQADELNSKIRAANREINEAVAQFPEVEKLAASLWQQAEKALHDIDAYNQGLDRLTENAKKAGGDIGRRAFARGFSNDNQVTPYRMGKAVYRAAIEGGRHVPTIRTIAVVSVDPRSLEDTPALPV